jgi:fructose transport system ATP-binding protein
MEPILKGRGLSSAMAGGRARQLRLRPYPGEILAVIGDNGAGKSTLIKALSGALTPDEGKIWLEGKEVNFHSPIDGARAGIETVYQTLAMSPGAVDRRQHVHGPRNRKPGFMGKCSASSTAPRWRNSPATSSANLA